MSKNTIEIEQEPLFEYKKVCLYLTFPKRYILDLSLLDSMENIVRHITQNIITNSNDIKNVVIDFISKGNFPSVAHIGGASTIDSLKVLTPHIDEATIPKLLPAKYSYARPDPGMGLQLTRIMWTTWNAFLLSIMDHNSGVDLTYKTKPPLDRSKVSEIVEGLLKDESGSKYHSAYVLLLKNKQSSQ